MTELTQFNPCAELYNWAVNIKFPIKQLAFKIPTKPDFYVGSYMQMLYMYSLHPSTPMPFLKSQHCIHKASDKILNFIHFLYFLSKHTFKASILIPKFSSHKIQLILAQMFPYLMIWPCYIKVIIHIFIKSRMCSWMYLSKTSFCLNPTLNIRNREINPLRYKTGVKKATGFNK